MSRLPKALVLAPLFLLPHMALAETATSETAENTLAIELNAAESIDGSCKLTFVLTNSLGSPLDKLVYEAVLFDTSGKVDRLTLFNFGSLPVKRARVRQLVVPGAQCDGLGRVLFNGANACEGEGVDPAACDAGLEPSTRTEIEVVG
ncbi:hypothetical protein [Neptunicoccus cionae]|uniref:hypothetical protein n=1 Tax=Neptunicoccus cionae TaxID=2035344 RepID=UPI000C775799|nr:hypothetical protein [Amylibacter cionae]PLS21304.1 hypothetical protein C0U40_10895 [Amylibacter cionae]